MSAPGMDPRTIVRQSSRTAARVIDGQAVVIVIDRRRLHTLNGVGTRIWELADGRSLAEIADVLVKEFEVDRDTALQHAGAFVAEMVQVGAMEAG